MADRGLIARTRAFAGAVARDWPRYARALGRADASYLSLCNRGERLEAGPGGRGLRCDWDWTSDLHAARVLPGLGLRLLRRALADHPVLGAGGRGPSEAPRISFIIGHRGKSRLPLLLATLRSIAAQQGTRIECIVVEQDERAVARASLPPWVRHVHTPPPRADMPYSRSWAFNVGVRHARAPVLVLHDNDMLAPVDYAASVLSHIGEGYEVANLKRFVFYLDEAHTAAVLAGREPPDARPPAAITQNLEGGGSVAITREAYIRIGGMDESFIGWGGEDNEFWERARTLRVWAWAYLPIVHLWHAPQPGKQEAGNPTLAHYRRLSAIAPADRIASLRKRPAGLMSGPMGAGGSA